VAIVGTMLYFAIRYRKKDGVDHETPHIEGHAGLELIWTVVPSIICIFVAYYGFVIYEEVREPPPNAMQINVTGQKWRWDFEYENGKRTSSELVVPVNEPVKFRITSRDVLHSFFVPAMRVKIDAVPNQYTQVWFNPVKTGEFQVFCTEYCGLQHSAMLAKLHVVSRAEYDRWLNDKSEEMIKLPPEKLGKQLFVKKGCNACHSLDGTKVVGPSFLKLYGKTEELEGGASVVVDDNYIKKSILEPAAQIVKGYAPAMPSFDGQLNDKEMEGLIAFIKSVQEPVKIVAPVKKDEKPDSELTPVEHGKKIYETKLCVTCHSLDGAKLVGPSWKGLYGRRGKLVDGSEYDANDEYIKHSILKPADQIVEGYQPVMPPYEGQLNDKDIADVIEFMKTLK
jgi:cytochrome c oxidase subunit 2